MTRLALAGKVRRSWGQRIDDRRRGGIALQQRANATAPRPMGIAEK